MLFAILCLFAMTQCQEYDVIVVGSGLAGLGAGKYFHDNNVSKFLILEANDYIGGRVKNIHWYNQTIPLGAGWLHVVDEDHELYKKHLQYNMSLYTDTYWLNKVEFRNGNDGSIIPSEEVGKVNSRIVAAQDKMDELVEQRVENGQGTIDLKSGLRWGGFKAKTPLENAIEYFRYEFENGIEPDVIDAVGYGYSALNENVHERIVNDPRGYGFPVFEESKPYQSKIKLNKTATKITMHSKNNITIECKDGTSYTTKNVLVTVSTGVLQSGNIEFSPTLPEWKTGGLNMAPMCHYCKIFLRFNTVFWDDSKSYVMLATERKGHFVHWENMNADGLFPGSKILLATLTGDICRESYTFTDNEIIEQAYQVLKKVYPNATRPIEMKRNDFSINPNFLGSYSYQIAGINENDYKAMDHPVQQSIYFAGEAYQRWEFGYAHGAYDSGLGAAKNITNCMRDKDKCATDSPKFDYPNQQTPSHAVRITMSLEMLSVVFAIMFFKLL